MKVLTTSVPSLLSEIIYYAVIGVGISGAALATCQLTNSGAVRYAVICTICRGKFM